MSLPTVKETVRCRCDKESQEWFELPIYVVVWHGVYGGYALTEEDKSAIWRYFHLPDDVRRDPDPLARILERNDPKEPSPNGGFDYWA